MSGRKDLIFRTDYFGDAAAWEALAALLEDVFGIDVTILDRLGGPDPTSIAFAWFDTAGACIANISAFSLPLVINGIFVRAAGLLGEPVLASMLVGGAVTIAGVIMTNRQIKA